MDLSRLARTGMLASAILLQGSAAAHGSTAIQPAGWAVYANIRYGYQVCYPPRVLRPQGESDNSDGQVFSAPDGGELRVYGTNNVMNDTLAASLRETGSRLSGPHGRVTYRVLRATWGVVSGEDGLGHVFYAKTVMRRDQFLAFELTYPRAQAAAYGSIAAAVSQCFAVGPRGGF
jgi:hypothetical protein